MSSEQIPEATESINLPSPSIAPAFFAFGVLLAIAGLYLVFMGPSWAYVAIGLIVAFAASVSMVRTAIRSFFRLPRRQELSAAPLPADSIKARHRAAR